MVAQELNHNTEVEFFSYRTASVGEVFLKVPRALLKELEEALARKAGVRRDNHTAYGMKYEGVSGNHTTYIMFTDGEALFGRKISKEGF